MYVFTFLFFLFFVLVEIFYVKLIIKIMEFCHLLLNFVEFLMWADVKEKEIVKFLKKLDSLSIFTHTVYLPLLYPRSSRVAK